MKGRQKKALKNGRVVLNLKWPVKGQISMAAVQQGVFMCRFIYVRERAKTETGVVFFVYDS